MISLTGLIGCFSEVGLFACYAGVGEDMGRKAIAVGAILVEHLRHASHQAVEVFRRSTPLVLGKCGEAWQRHILHVGEVDNPFSPDIGLNPQDMLFLFFGELWQLRVEAVGCGEVEQETDGMRLSRVVALAVWSR